jgi:hypothetical protein
VQINLTELKKKSLTWLALVIVQFVKNKLKKKKSAPNRFNNLDLLFSKNKYLINFNQVQY